MLDARFDDLYAIIPHPMEPHILLLGGEHGYALPRATVPLLPTDHRWRDTARESGFRPVTRARRHNPRVSRRVSTCPRRLVPAVGHQGRARTIRVLPEKDAGACINRQHWTSRE